MNSSPPTTLLRVLLVASTIALISSCHAAPPDQTQPPTPRRDIAEKIRPTPTATAALPTITPTPSIAPSPTPTPNCGSGSFVIEPIELRAPKEPIRVEAQIKPAEVKPFEIKPVEIRFPKEPVQFNAIPVEMKWPQEPLKVSVDIKAGGEKQESSMRSCDCTHPPEDARPKTVDSNEWQKRTDELEKKIDADLAAALKELEEQRKANKISQEAFEEEKKKLAKESEVRRKGVPETLRKDEISDERWRILELVFAAGIIGGLAIHTLEYLRTTKPFKKDLKTLRADDRKNRKARYAAPWSQSNEQLVKELDQKIRANEQEQEDLREHIRSERRTWWTRYELGPVLFLGVVAAFMVPGALLFIPLVKLQDVSANPFGYISLGSFCFITAMIGEPFIEFVLQKLRNLTTEKEAQTKTVPSDEAKASKPPSAQDPQSSP